MTKANQKKKPMGARAVKKIAKLTPKAGTKKQRSKSRPVYRARRSDDLQQYQLVVMKKFDVYYKF